MKKYLPFIIVGILIIAIVFVVRNRNKQNKLSQDSNLSDQTDLGMGSAVFEDESVVESENCACANEPSVQTAMIEFENIKVSPFNMDSLTKKRNIYEFLSTACPCLELPNINIGS